MGKSRGIRKGDLSYAVQPGITHETLHHYDTHDPVAEGKLSLDDPANNHLAKSKIIGANGNADAATVRRLGAHVSGLPTMFAMFDRNEANLAPSPEALLTEYGSLAYPSWSCYEYSNVGFAALSAIASNLTGVEIGTLMTQSVLTPLGLDDSFFGTSVARLPTGAVRYDSSGNPIPDYTTATPASGEQYASAHDLARFAMFNMKNRYRARILDDRWIEELHKPVFVGPSGGAITFGWFTTHLKSGEQVIFKGGGQPGVTTDLYMVPSQKLACLVLTNRTGGRELCLSVCNEILSSYLPEWRQLEETAGPSPSPFVITYSLGGHWQGTLTNDGAKMQVRLKIESSDSATLQLDDKPAEKITEMHLEGVGFTCHCAPPRSRRKQETITLRSRWRPAPESHCCLDQKLPRGCALRRQAVPARSSVRHLHHTGSCPRHRHSHGHVHYQLWRPAEAVAVSR